MSEAKTTNPIRLSYANSLYEAKAFQAGDTPKYSVTLLFKKNDKADMVSLKSLYDGAMEDLTTQWPDERTRPRIPIMGHDLSPIKDADKACDKQGIPILEKNPEYAGHYTIRASSTEAPILVDRGRNEIIQKGKIYSG